MLRGEIFVEFPRPTVMTGDTVIGRTRTADEICVRILQRANGKQMRKKKKQT